MLGQDLTALVIGCLKTWCFCLQQDIFYPCLWWQNQMFQTRLQSIIQLCSWQQNQIFQVWTWTWCVVFVPKLNHVSTYWWFTATHISNTASWMWFKLPCVIKCFRGIWIFLNFHFLLSSAGVVLHLAVTESSRAQLHQFSANKQIFYCTFFIWNFSPLSPLRGHLSQSSFNDSVCTLCDTEAEKMRSHRSQTDSSWSSRKPPIWNFNSHFEKRKSSYNEAGCCFQRMSTVHHLWGRFPQQQLQPHTELGVITESVCRNIYLSISVARWCYGANYDQVH